MSHEAFMYVGWSIKHEDGKIKIDQNDYIHEKCTLIEVVEERAKLREEPVNSKERSSLRAAIGKGRWLTDKTRPDCSFNELELSMGVNSAKVRDIFKLNKMFKKMKLESITLTFQKVRDINKLRFSVFSDASFANP